MLFNLYHRFAILPPGDGNTLTDQALSNGRKASATQGWTLASANWLAAIATAVLSPVLPKIAQYFHGDPHVAVLVSLLATMPALFVALGAWPAGFLADRFGTRRVLLFGVGIYGFIGCSPIILHSLAGIVATRAGVGMTEAIIMTCSTALVADYFHGSDRERWLAVQTGGGGIVAVIMIALGGVLGESSWRLPFAMYGIAFVLFPLCVFKTWEPAKHKGEYTQHPKAEASLASLSKPADADKDKPYNWTPLILISLVTLFASTAFYLLIIQLSFVLTERGVTASGTIGLGCAVAVLFGTVGAVVFKLLRLSVAGKLTISFTLFAVGFFIVAISRGFLATEIGASINQIGAGMVLPTLITWALSELTIEVRARGTGIWQTAMFLGQFLSPLIVLALKNLSGSLSNAVLIYAVACSIAAVASAVSCIRSTSRTLVEAE
jgi:MFS family permease